MKNKFTRFAGLITAGALCLFMLVLTAAAQDSRGTIAGIVTDPNGAVVPNASVVIKNVDTNVAVTLRTNDEGAYTLSTLSPGQYNVTASITGFKTATREKV